MKTRIKVPGHLSPGSKRWYRGIAESFVLESHHERLLTLAAEAWDRHQEARELLKKDGLTFVDKAGSVKSHPAVAIERDSRTAFARLVRELNLDTSPADLSRPPGLRNLKIARAG